MDNITAEKNFNLIDKHPKGNFYVNKHGKIIEIGKWNLIGRVIKHYSNRNGAVRRKVNDTIVETLRVVKKEPLQKQALLLKLANFRGISMQVLDEKVQNAATAKILKNLPSSNLQPTAAVDTLDKPSLISITMPKVGFVNEGNTCYLAATLQILRNIPVIREHLNSPLKRWPINESDESMKLRKKAKDCIVELIKAIDKGEHPVTGLKKLEKLYIDYRKLRGDDFHKGLGRGGDVREFYDNMTLILNIRAPYIEFNVGFNVGNYERSEPEALEVTNRALDRHMSYYKQGPPKILLGSRANQNTKHFFSHQEVITLTASDGKKYSYSIVGTTRSSDFHAVAYLRDHQKKEWVACNDSHVQRICDLNPALHPKLRYVYYALVEES
jgi:hypothetical protein